MTLMPLLDSYTETVREVRGFIYPICYNTGRRFVFLPHCEKTGVFFLFALICWLAYMAARLITDTSYCIINA